MTLAVKTVQVPQQHVRALTELKTVNKEERTIDVVWTTGARGLRYGWDGSYYEELSLDPAHLRMDRLKSGASVLDSHDRSSGLKAVLGAVRDAWIVSPTEARATLELSDDPAKAGVVNDILSGKIRNVSVGYSIFKMVEVGREGDIPVLRAEDWEPYELSFVPVPFDAGATSRSGEETLNNCEVSTTQRTKKMDPVEQARLDAERAQRDADHTRALEETSRKAVENERKRSIDIHAAVEKAGLERKVADDYVAQGKSVESVRELVLDMLAERNKQTASSPITAGSLDEKTTTIRAMEEHLLSRIAPQFNKPTELSQRYRSASMLDICRDTIRMAGGRPENLSKSEIANRALHTTSDFATVVGSSLKKVLSFNYEGTPADWAFLTQPQGMTDYKTLMHVGLSAGPRLLEIKEHGEYKRGTLQEQQEAMALKKHGRIIGITREALINDDLGALQRLPRQWATAARNLESDLIIGQILGNPVMGDNVTLFNLAHGNLAATPSVLSIQSLSDAVAALESQTGLASTDGTPNYLRLRAKYLIVGPSLKTLATQLTTSIDPVTFQTVNPFGYLEVKSDPAITGTQWYVAAEPGNIDTIALMYLEGERGLQLDERIGFDVDGLEYKARLDTGAKILDWRWIYKNAGV